MRRDLSQGFKFDFAYSPNSSLPFRAAAPLQIRNRNDRFWHISEVTVELTMSVLWGEADHAAARIDV
jgi:hypothetical protein